MTGEHIKLVRAERLHQHAYLRWFNDFFVQRTSGLLPMPWTPGSFKPWFENRVMNAEDAVWFTILERETNRPVGFCGVRDINHLHQTAEYFITVGEADSRGKGYGTEATSLTLRYAFEELNLHNVLLDVISASRAGIRAYEKAGFREIGRRREAVRMGTGWYDWVYMECLATEFSRQDSDAT